jgi:hypothetical protein
MMLLSSRHVPRHHVFEHGKLFWMPEGWPPNRPKVGMLAVLFGYPGQGRKPDRSGDLGASPLSLSLPVVSVSERHFVLMDKHQDAHALVPAGQSPLANFGGVSGSAGLRCMSLLCDGKNVHAKQP